MRASSSAPEPTGRSPIRLMKTWPRPHASRMNPWRMPPELEPYRHHIVGNGEPIERLMDVLDLEPNLAQTNLVLCGIALTVKAQVDLLRRLLADGCLPPAPNGDGGWGG